MTPENLHLNRQEFDAIVWDILGELEDAEEVFTGSSGEAVQDTISVCFAVAFAGVTDVAGWREWVREEQP